MTDPGVAPIWQTLITVVASPVLAALTTLTITRMGERDKIAVHIEWFEAGGHDYPPFVAPHLVVQNLTQRTVFIVDVIARHGIFRQHGSQTTVLAYDDPAELPFPCGIAPGAIRSFMLEGADLVREVNKVGRLGNWAGSLYGRNRIVIEAKTLAGTRARVGGEKALPSDQMPNWLFRPWWGKSEGRSSDD